jgi:hypothetical protein
MEPVCVSSIVLFGLATGRLVNSFAVHTGSGAVYLAVELLNDGSAVLVDSLEERDPSQVTHEAHASDQNSDFRKCTLAELSFGL